MKVSKPKKPSIRNEILMMLQKNDRIQIGRSKHADKLEDKKYIATAGEDFDRTKLLRHQYYYSDTTLNNNIATGRVFANWPIMRSVIV